MTHVKLYCAQESQPGKQELVWAVWQRHFQTPSELPAGVLAATFVNQTDDSSGSRVCFEFSERQHLDNFESSVAFNNYIWDVLPLLAQQCTISYADGFTSDKGTIQAGAGAAPSVHKFMRGIGDLFSVLHRPMK